MARRRNTIAKRLAKMQGLPRDEKEMLVRVGNLIDAALNNRQPGNPYEPARNKNSRIVYPVTGLTTTVGVRRVKLVWDATPSDILLRYEVTITNTDDGTTVVKTTFTNNLSFYGAQGKYNAKVISVGRDGSSSPIEMISAFIKQN